MTLSGATVANSGNIILSNVGISTVTLSATSINNTGSITNNGTSTGATTISGAIGANVTNIVHSAAGSLTFSSPTVANTGNITFSGTGASVVTFSAAAINTVGSITNSGGTTGTTTISGVLGSTVMGVLENSGTSALTLSGANTSFTGPVTIKLGTVNLLTSGSAAGTGTVTLGDSTPGNSNAASLLESGATTDRPPPTRSPIRSRCGRQLGTLTIGNNASGQCNLQRRDHVE